MAGTPTPNYNFPTYAETDVPDLAGAYNQAVNAIDAKIKEVADTIPSDVDVPDANSMTKGIAKLYDSASIGDSTQEDGGVTPAALKAAVEGAGVDVSGKADKFTATAPITYSENKIGIRYSNPSADGSQNGYGAVQVTGKQLDVANADSLTTATVPNVKAVKDYVDAKVPVEQQAYTGTAPIAVDAGQRKISIDGARYLTPTIVNDFVSALHDNGDAYLNYGGASLPVVDRAEAVATIKTANTAENNWPAARTVPTLGAMDNAIATATPDATTAVKGLVRLAATYSGGNTAQAATGGTIAEAFSLFLNNWPDIATAATTKLTTEMLANLYVTPSGIVVYKAPSE